MKGAPLSPRIFNLIVDAIIRKQVNNIFSEEARVKGIGEETHMYHSRRVYAGELVSTSDPDMLQRAFSVLTAFFGRIGFRDNVKKTETFPFMPGAGAGVVAVAVAA